MQIKCILNFIAVCLNIFFDYFCILINLINELGSEEKSTDTPSSVQSLYNIHDHNTNWDSTRPCCGSHIYLPWNFTNELHG